MAADTNSIVLVGRLTRDIELRNTPGGTSVANIRLAYTTRQKSGDTWEDKSNYVDVVLFGGMADNAAKYLGKGRRVGVQGRLAWREWEGQDGNKRQAHEIVAENLQYLDSTQSTSGVAPASDIPAAAPAAAPVPDDGVPF